MTRNGLVQKQLDTQQSYRGVFIDSEDNKTYTFANSKYPTKQYLN